mgnify:CR=1 FL=1
MRISVDRDSSVPIYKQIEGEMRNKILNNEIVYGTRLPSERYLASALGVHRNTVIKAYKYLVDQGLVSCSLPGRKGYFVIFDALAEDGERTEGAKRPAVFRYRGEPGRYEKLFDAIYNISFDEQWISFGGHILPTSLIQLDEIKAVLAKVVEQYGVEAFTYCSSKGMPQLRKQLSLSLREEGIKVTPGEIVIINETFQGLEYVARLLAEKNDYVITESPVMPDVLRIFAMQGLKVLTVPLEEDGVNLTQLENLVRIYKPKFFHTMPDYHAITGVRMSLKKRYDLLKLADRYNLPLIEEKWYSGISFTEEMFPSLYALDERKSVITIDNAINFFYTGARICYLLAPIETAKLIGQSISNAQVHLQSLEQAMFAEYLQAGYHICQQERMCRFYKEKCRKMERLLQPLKKLGVSWNTPLGGMGFWCRLPQGVNDIRLYEALKKRRVLICPGKVFEPYGTEAGSFIRLSFSNVSDKKMKEGIEILYEELEKICRK